MTKVENGQATKPACIFIALMGAALLLLLPGCGGETVESRPAIPVRAFLADISSNTVAARTAEYRYILSSSTSATSVIAGTYNFSNSTGTGLGGNAGGAAPTYYRFLGATIYAKMPGKNWTVHRFPAVNPLVGLSDLELPTVNPGVVVSRFGAVITAPKEVHKTTLFSVAVTEYTAEVSSTVSGVGSLGDVLLFWVDGQDRLRQVRVPAYRLPGVFVTVQYPKFGVSMPVVVAPPPF